jgi:hypothetical protein
VRDLVVGSGIEFNDRGTHALKGVPGEWRLLAVADQPSAPSPPRAGDQRMPNAEVVKAGDRTMARIAQTAPAVGRTMSRVTGFRSRRRAERRRHEALTATAPEQ